MKISRLLTTATTVLSVSPNYGFTANFGRKTMSFTNGIKMSVRAHADSSDRSVMDVKASSDGESDKDQIGLALSGGIYVAAAGGAATMRGFQQQCIVVDGEERPAMEAFDYISGLSGGTIPTMLYCYAQNVDSATLLDADFRINDPSEITSEVLDRRTENSIFETVTDKFTDSFIPSLLYGVSTGALDKIWTMSILNEMLSPFGIEGNKTISPKSDETNDTSDLILPRSGINAIPLSNFIMAGEAKDSGRSIIDAYLEVIKCLNKKKWVNKFVPREEIVEAIQEVEHEILMAYVGGSVDVRNGYVSSNGTSFRSILNSIPAKKWGATDSPLSLEFLVGMGTNFLGMGAVTDSDGKFLDIVKDALKDEDVLEYIGDHLDGGNIKEIMKDGEYRNKIKTALTTDVLTMAAHTRKVDVGDGGGEREMLFVDGGLIDGLGVPALVQRKVRTIVSSIWGHGKERKYERLYSKTKGENLDTWLSEGMDIGIADIASYFGFYQGEKGLFMNRMFEDGVYHLGQLRKTFDALFEAGKPLVITLKDLKTVENPFWGIEAGKTVDLTIIYYTLPKSFSEKVALETDKDGSFVNKEFKDFPNLDGLKNFDYGDKTNNILMTGALTTRQANMAAYLGSWVINEAWEGLTVDGKKVFGGFKELLENSSGVA
mmetsp:Transcript_2767/g.3188  ORF Transcript_2767/g.3188 Transcript_2767/m.3188 type:complete len:658 (-) Transcript_2767:224-2197(-)